MDDSRLKLGFQSCSVVFFFKLVVGCRLIQKCPIFGSFADTEFRPGTGKFSLARGYLTNFMVLESSPVLCCIAYKK